MTKPVKLYEQLLGSPGTIISFRDFERLIEAFGFEHKRPREAIAIMCMRMSRQS